MFLSTIWLLGPVLQNAKGKIPHFSNQRKRPKPVRGNKGPAEAPITFYLAAQRTELQSAGRRAVERDSLEIGLLERQIAISRRAARAPRLRATPPVDEGVRGLCAVDVRAPI